MLRELRSAVAARRPAQGRNLFFAYLAFIPQRALRAPETCRATIGRPAEAGTGFQF
jgi:hypothetical protein